MKNILALLFLLVIVVYGHSQSHNTIDANNIEAVFHSDGLLFSAESQQDAGFLNLPNDDGERPATIFAANLWAGGITSNGDVYASRQFYYGLNSISTYQAGPSNVGELSFDFNRVWKVTGAEIRAFKEDWSDGVLDQIPAQNILDWPAKGNENLPNFPDQELAPFFDLTGDGIYNPSTGDYPIIGNDFPGLVPDQILYSVFNDSPNTFDAAGVEFHTLAYAFTCEEEEAVNNTVFTRHIIKNKTRNYEEFYLGFWKDPDLGCFTDDMIGCSVEQNCVYTYNEDPIDGIIGNECDFGIASFQDVPPVQTMKYLNHPMSSFMTYNGPNVDGLPAMHSPVIAQEVFYNLNGTWRDGTPLTFGGIGYDPSSVDVVNHLYPDIPTDDTGWSMYSLQLPPYDMRLLSNTFHGTFNQGEEIVLDLAHFVSTEEGYSHIQNVEKAIDDAVVLGELYDNDFQNDCNFFLSSAIEIETSSFSIYPNPTTDILNFKSDDKFNSYQIYDMIGRVVQSGELENKFISISELQPGLYSLKLNFGETKVTKKFAIQ